MYIVSACLLGIDCKYTGGNNDCDAVKALLVDNNYIAVCPEVAGGLPVPRNPFEIRDGRVFDKDGEEVTEAFLEGAEKAYEEAVRRAELLEEDITLAILKSRSPSCGVNKIYDGTFSGKLIKGDGVFASLLRDKGIKLLTEEEVK